MRRLIFRVGKGDRILAEREQVQFFERMFAERKAKRSGPNKWMKAFASMYAADSIVVLGSVTNDWAIPLHRYTQELGRAMAAQFIGRTWRVGNPLVQAANVDYSDMEIRYLDSYNRLAEGFAVDRRSLFSLFYGRSPFFDMEATFDYTRYRERKPSTKFHQIEEWYNAARYVEGLAATTRNARQPVIDHLYRGSPPFKHDPLESQAMGIFRLSLFPSYDLPTHAFGFQPDVRRDKHAYDTIQQESERQKLRPRRENTRVPHYGKTKNGKHSLK